ncbi:MAG TPA: sigma-70 family RNA polymerase sigma factor [Streptosporangiaceae bacterium]
MTDATDMAPTVDAARAIDDLYRAHGLALTRFALMLVGDQTTAEDVVQEAFIGLYRGWHRVNDPENALERADRRRCLPPSPNCSNGRSNERAEASATAVAVPEGRRFPLWLQAGRAQRGLGAEG